MRVRPLDSARARVYIAPFGLWLTLDAGAFETVEILAESVRVTLAAATPYTTSARLRVEQPARVAGSGAFAPAAAFTVERGAYVVPLGNSPVPVTLTASGR